MTRPDVWLVRHGETEWSRSGRHTGSTDVDLTEAGRGAARALGAVLGSHAFGTVLTSPLTRARATCELAGLGDRSIEDADLREWDYGDYEGRTTNDIRTEHPGWTVWRDGCPGGESAADVGVRADRVVVRLLESDGDVAVFGHGHALRVLAARWVGLAPESGAVLALGTAAVSVLSWEREQRVIGAWNVTALSGL